MTHRGEKPHTCLYCPVASSRKDVIVRHMRNFHPQVVDNGHASSTSNDNRQTNADSQASRPNAVPRNGSAPESPPSPAAPAENAQGSYEPEASDARHHNNDLPLGDPMNHDQGTQSAQLEECLLSLDDPFPPFLENSPVGVPGSLMEPPVSHSAFTETVDIQAFFSSAQDLMGVQSDNFGGQSPTPVCLLPDSIPRSKDSQQSSNIASFESTMAIEDSDCAKACAKLATYPRHIFDSMRLPSKYTIRRFVRVFFRHVAQHIPIVHEPTFNIAAAPSPLLLAIMASGAAFLSERAVANSMCSVAMQLIFHHDRQTGVGEVDCETKLAMLQVHLLLSYIGMHCGMEQWSAYAYPLAVNYANGALRELKAYPITAYKEWVLQESINRCLAVTVLIGAAPDSLEKERRFVTPINDIKFALPSRTADWLADEHVWGPPGDIISLDDAVRSVLSGRRPTLPAVSEFGLVTIVALILYRVCSFEALTTSFNEEMFPDFVDKMDKGVQALDDMLRDRLSKVKSGLPPDPTLQCAKSLLNSVFYHLYGSLPLASMKRLLSPTATATTLGDIAHLFDQVNSPHLYKAVGRAADQLRIDCQLGLEYLQRVAAHEFGPECAMSTFEGSLLLYWYLEFVQPLLPQLELRDTVRKLITEGFAEVHDLQLQLQDHIAVIPLAITSRLLSDKSVWQWPASVSNRLECFINSSRLPAQEGEWH